MNNKDLENEVNLIGIDKEEIDTLNNIDSEPEDKKKGGFIKSLYEWIDSFVVSFIIVVLVFTFFLGKVRVDGDSMKETLHDDDQLIVSDFLYKPERGDIVIISRNPENISEEEEKKTRQPIVKRVIAVEGDTIQITEDGKVLLNDKELDEPYIKDYALNLGTPQEHLLGKETVPENCIFVMGDNRHNSHDSRTNDIWMVDRRYVLGKVLFRLYPFEQIEVFD